MMDNNNNSLGETFGAKLDAKLAELWAFIQSFWQMIEVLAQSADLTMHEMAEHMAIVAAVELYELEIQKLYGDDPLWMHIEKTFNEDVIEWN